MTKIDGWMIMNQYMDENFIRENQLLIDNFDKI